MLEEVDRLASLVAALLMITRADAGNVPVQRAALRVMEVAREAANLYGVLIEEKSLRLVLDGDERVELEAYRVILKEAFVNIIHNTVNHSPAEDAIVVRVLNRDGTQVTVGVEDQGPGVPLDDQVKVFEGFLPWQQGSRRKPKWSWSGLAIAKSAVEASGGSIGLASAAGRGCTSRIILPRTRP
jgi:signal transduction histidine kinase